MLSNLLLALAGYYSVIILANFAGITTGLKDLLEATIVLYSCTEIESHRVK